MIQNSSQLIFYAKKYQIKRINIECSIFLLYIHKNRQIKQKEILPTEKYCNAHIIILF